MIDPQELIHHLLEKSQQTFFVYGVSAGRVLYVSAAYERLFPGARREDVDADLPHLLSFLPADDRAYAQECFGQLAAGHLHDDLLLRLQASPEAPLRWLAVQAWRSETSDG